MRSKTIGSWQSDLGLQRPSKQKTVNVANPSDVSATVIADSIVEIGRSMKKLSGTRLTRKAVVSLLHDSTKLGKREIELILDSLESLEETWLKK